MVVAFNVCKINSTKFSLSIPLSLVQFLKDWSPKCWHFHLQKNFGSSWLTTSMIISTLTVLWTSLLYPTIISLSKSCPAWLALVCSLELPIWFDSKTSLAEEWFCSSLLGLRTLACPLFYLVLFHTSSLYQSILTIG